MSSLWTHPSTPTRLGQVPLTSASTIPLFLLSLQAWYVAIFGFRQVVLLIHIHPEPSILWSIQPKCIKNVSNKWQKGHYSFIPSIECLLCNRDESFDLRAEAVIGAGEENCKCDWRENSELLKMLGADKEVAIPWVLLPLKCELKMEGVMCPTGV